MSLATRTWVCNQLAFLHDSDKSDLMNESLVDTRVIAFLQELLTERDGTWQGNKIIITAVRSDHPTWDGPDGHSGGKAVDLSQNGPDDAGLHLVQDIQRCENALGIGLGGPFWQYADACGGYNETSKLFQDNGTDHIHIQVIGY